MEVRSGKLKNKHLEQPSLWTGQQDRGRPRAPVPVAGAGVEGAGPWPRCSSPRGCQHCLSGAMLQTRESSPCDGRRHSVALHSRVAEPHQRDGDRNVTGVWGTATCRPRPRRCWSGHAVVAVQKCQGRATFTCPVSDAAGAHEPSPTPRQVPTELRGSDDTVTGPWDLRDGSGSPGPRPLGSSERG